MTWALRRQIFYLGVLIVVTLFFGFLIAYPYFNKAPSCIDNKQNGNETGVDCGGSCALACIAQVDPISVLWARSFRVVPGRYNAVAYVTNHNKDEVVKKISYRFRFADENNIYIGKRDGTTFVPAGGNFAIFEGGIDTGNSVPVYTSFEFTEAPVWLQVADEKINQLKLNVSDIQLENETLAPHLSASIKNNSLFFIPEIGVVAILYDASHNAVSVSSTLLDSLAGQEAKTVNFTWPEPFAGSVVTKEIIPLYDIFQVKIK